VVGEKVAVIGMGLLGLIAAQLVRAAGCRVIGADPNPARLELAKTLGCDRVCTPGQLAGAVAEFTRNLGVDAVIIAAATGSNEPTEQAAQIARKKGRVSVVGAVKMDIPRKPFYQKELQLRLSTSYGPGRYDSQYEEKGIDYPQAYVPWTEQRNMACVVDLMAQGKLDVRSLITHRCPIDQAEEAYRLVKGESNEPFLGIVLTYPQVENRRPAPVVSPSRTGRSEPAGGTVGVGVIGAGNFANLTMLPAIKSIPTYRLVGLADLNGISADHTASKFGFQRAVSDHRELLADPDIQAVFVTTRHNTHAPLVIEALRAGKHVMVEKPLCLTEDELREVLQAADERPDRKIMVGFNRRFAALTSVLRQRFSGRGPLCMHYVCNAGFSPKESWVHDPQVGGGRIIGEGCHFVDWMVHMTQSRPISVFAQCIGRETGKALTDDNVMISLRFEDGSIGAVSYLACGDKSHTKEFIQVYGGGAIGEIEDFRRGRFMANGKTEPLKSSAGKGHREEWEQFAQAVQSGGPTPIPFEQIVVSTWATLKAIESLHTGQVIEL